MIGTIVQWTPERGFGFAQTASGKNHFVHITQWMSEEPPCVGQHVSFTLAEGRPGKSTQAADVHLLSEIETGIRTGADALSSKVGA